jgi:hypothetical protein
LFASIAFSFATPAAAQEQTSFATARSMIESAQLTDVFEPVDDEHVTVRHRASGLVCQFFDNETRTQLATFDSGLPRGDDVACVADRDGSATTIYATRYNPRKSAEDALAEAVAGIRHRFPEAHPTPTALSITTEGMPASLVANFLVQVRGERWLTSATVAQSGDWIVKLRFSARALEDDALLRTQLEAGAMFAATLLRMHAAN